MRNFLLGLGVSLLIGACAGGAIPPLGMMARAPAVTANSPNITAAIGDARRPQADRDRDAARHPADILAFVGVRDGMRVADVGPGGGYYTRLFAVAVGESGHVYGIDRPNRAPDQPRASLAVAAEYTNATIIQQGYQGWHVDQSLDVIFISQIYHDFHLPAANLDVPQINRDMFAALRPGGELIIIDHSAVAGFDPAHTDDLHRIDQALARRELEAAGFVYVDESQVLRNPADTRTERVFEGDIRGHTDQFVMRFRKPA
jgi:predicted methyltransferase